MELPQFLCLPSIRMLQDVSSCLQVGDNSDCVTFFQSKAAMLKPSEPSEQMLELGSVALLQTPT